MYGSQSKATPSLFGGNNQTSQGGSLFGSTANTGTPGFQKSSSLFGNNNAPSTGAQASGLFQPKKSAFGGGGGLSTQNAAGGSGGSSLFGNNNGGILKKQPSTLFPSSINTGSQQPSNSLFGQNQTNQTAPLQQQTGLLGLNSAATAGGSFSAEPPKFGQHAQLQKQTSLFGGGQTQTNNQSTGGGLFGNKPQSSLFGGGGQLQQTQQPQQQPQNSLFGGQPLTLNPQQSIIGQSGQQMQQFQQQFGFGAQNNQQLQQQQQQAVLNPQQMGMPQQAATTSDMYYCFSKIWDTQMMQQLGESMVRSQVSASQMQTGLSRRNPFTRQQIKDLKNFDQFATEAKNIEDQFKSDQENLQQTKQRLTKTTGKISQLDDQIETAQIFLSNLSKGQKNLQFQIQGLSVEMNKLNQFREHLGFQISAYQSQGNEFYHTMQVPSEFFFQLHQHHEKLLEQYNHKIEEAEILAKVVCDEAQKAQATPDGASPNQMQSFKQMKAQIYNICKYIYDQQKQTAAQLYQIERNTSQLRQNFVQIMMKKKNYVGSIDEIDMLFEGQQDEPDQVYNDVMQKLKEIKNRNVASKLVQQLHKMDMLGTKDKEQSESKQLNKALTSLFGPEGKDSKKTIKESLSKGLYTMDKRGGKESVSTMFSTPGQYIQGSQGMSVGGSQHYSSSSMLGKRMERKHSPMDEFTYFKRPNKSTPGGPYDQYETPDAGLARNLSRQLYQTPEDSLGISQTVRFRASDRNRLY